MAADVPHFNFSPPPIFRFRAAQIQTQDLRVLMCLLGIAEVAAMEIKRFGLRSDQIKKQPGHQRRSFLQGKAEFQNLVSSPPRISRSLLLKNESIFCI